MPKSKTSKALAFPHFKNHLIPSIAGGGVAYLLSGVVLLGAAVFAAVWVGNMIVHNMHKK